MSKQKRSVSKYYTEKMKSENELSLTSRLLSFARMTLCSWSCYRDCLTYEPAAFLECLRQKTEPAWKTSDWSSICVLAAPVAPLLLGQFALLWVCHSGRVAFEVLISSTSCYPSVVKWYVRTERVLIGGFASYQVARQPISLLCLSHWMAVYSLATLVWLGLPYQHMVSSLTPHFSLHITKRLNFYKSYVHKTFFLSSNW